MQSETCSPAPAASVTLNGQSAEPPAVKWRCRHCGAAFQEPRGVRADGKVEIMLMCHRCRKLSHLELINYGS